MLNKQKVSQFLFHILALILVLDPTNTIFGVKELAFGVYMLSCVVLKCRINLNMLYVVLLYLIVLLISLLSGYLLRSIFDFQYVTSFFKSFLFLLVLIYAKELDYNRYLLSTSVIIAILTIVVGYIFLYRYDLSRELYQYFQEHNNFIMVNLNRRFLDVKVISIFYKTSPILVFPLAFFFYRFLKQRRKVYFLSSLLCFAALLISGTRANMLSATLIVSLFTIHAISRKHKGFAYVLFVLGIVLASRLTILLLTEKEESVNIKTLHIKSIFATFEQKPLSLFFGQGPGSLYYTTAINEYVPYTEVSYFEIIRIFGIIGGSVVIGIFIAPLIIAYKNKKIIPEYPPFIIAYTAYLIIGGTNPLLLGSTGFLVLAAAYSFTLRASSCETKN